MNKLQWWIIVIFINANNPYLLFTVFPIMKHFFKRRGWDLIHPKQWIGRLSIEVTTKSSHIESYFLTHSNHPHFHHHSTSTPFIQLDTIIPCSSRIAEIQTIKHPLIFIKTINFHSTMQHNSRLNESIISASLSYWISMDYAKQTTETLPSFLSSLLYAFQCGIQGFNIHTHIIPLPILSTFHTLQNQMKTDNHIHIVFSPNTSTLLFILLEILFIPLLFNNNTRQSKNTIKPFFDILLFPSLQCLVLFSSVTNWRGFCLTISLMGSLSVFGCI